MKMTIIYYYSLLKGKYNEIRRNAQQRECMVIPNKRNTSINGIGGLVFHYQVIGQNEHRNIEVPGREIDNGINNNNNNKDFIYRGGHVTAEKLTNLWPSN